MKIAIFTSSPNVEGLTASCGFAASRGAVEGGAEVLNIDLDGLRINRCDVCGNGWGSCLDEHICRQEDDFEKLHSQIADCDAYIVVTPVYWGEMSETAKAFFDRLRRCEAWKKEQSIFYGKPAVGVAAAGGSGNGTLSCLESMERLFKHMGADVFDLIGVTRKNRAYKLETIKNCAKTIAELEQ